MDKEQTHTTQQDKPIKPDALEDKKQAADLPKKDIICVCRAKYLGGTDGDEPDTENFHSAKDHVDSLVSGIVSLLTQDFGDTKDVRKRIYQRCEIVINMSKISLLDSGFVDLASVIRDRHEKLKSMSPPDEATLKCLYSHSLFVLSSLRMYGLPMLQDLCSFCKDCS